MIDAGRTSLVAGVLVALLGLLAWATGQPAIFPSLGPTAFVLGLDHHSNRDRAVRIIGAHAIGGIAGLLAWMLVGPTIPITGSTPPLSDGGFRLAISATLSLVVTSWGMVSTDLIHPPACATTLIVSLGLLSIPGKVGLILASVTVLVIVHAILYRTVPPWNTIAEYVR